MLNTLNDAPTWVQSDAACRHAWQHQPGWRKAARSALPPVHRPPGDGGTTGDALLQRAWRAYGEARGASKEARGERRHHAEGCPCAPCRKRRGEKALPTLRQLQEKRKRSLGVEPGDREEWLLTAHDAVRWARVVDIERDPRDKITTCELRPAFLTHLDKMLRKDLIEDLWANQPHLARAFTACALDGRRQDDVAQQEECSTRTIRRRVADARAYLAQRLGVAEPSRSR